MQRRPVAQQDWYMSSCTADPELLPLSSSTWSILHDRHYFSLECETLGSSSKNDEVQNHRSKSKKIHNWPPRLCQLGQPRVACYSKAKDSCWRTAENKPNCGGTTVRNSRLFHRMTSITTDQFKLGQVRVLWATKTRQGEKLLIIFYDLKS